MGLEVGLSLLTLIPGQVGGSESYVRGLLGALDGADGLTVLTNRHVTAAYAQRLPAGATLHEVRSYRTGTTMPTRALAMMGARVAPRLVAREVPASLDVVHYPLTVPIPSTPAAKVVTLHDVQHLELPQFFSRAERAYRRWAYDGAARGADRVITVSEHGRRAAIERLGLDPARVTAIHSGIDLRRFDPGPVDGDEAALAPYSLPERFLVYPANLWPHKNHARLIEALARAGDRELPLILTGQDYGRLDAVLGRARDLGLGDRVRHLGYVQPEVIPALLRRATAMVFPSLYEGFGAPPLEAMACGCPVASSTEAALDEIVADAALGFDPRDVDAIAAAIDRVAADEGLRERLRRAGIERAAGFTWASSAEAHRETWRAAAGT